MQGLKKSKVKIKSTTMTIKVIYSSTKTNDMPFSQQSTYVFTKQNAKAEAAERATSTHSPTLL